MQSWEQVALGAIIVVVMILGFPRIKNAMKESGADDKPKDWMGVLVPVGLVVLFVLLLIQLA